MILQELIKSTSLMDIEKKLCHLVYMDTVSKGKSFYEDLYKQLLSAPINDSNTYITIHVDMNEEENLNNRRVHYSLYRRYKQQYALDFVSIQDLANAHLVNEEIENADIYLAYILQELGNCLDKEDIEYVKKQELARKQRDDVQYCSVEDVLMSIEK